MGLEKDMLEAAFHTFGRLLRVDLARRFGLSDPDADDLLQRSFERAWFRRNFFQGDRLEELKPWIWGIARNEYLLSCRTRSRQDRRDSVFLIDSLLFLPLTESAPELYEQVRHCLTRLQPRDRRIVELFYGSNDRDPLPDEQVAALLEAETSEVWKPERVRKRRSLALAQLRACMKGVSAEPDLTGVKTMSTSRIRRPVPSHDPRDLKLLALLTRPSDPRLRHVRSRLLERASDRQRLAELLEIEMLLLAAPGSNHLEASSGTLPPLSPSLEARVLSGIRNGFVDGADAPSGRESSPGLEYSANGLQTADSRGATRRPQGALGLVSPLVTAARQPRRWFGHPVPMLAAAIVLLAVTGTLLRHQLETRPPQLPVERLRGEDGPASSVPLEVLLQHPGAAAPEELTLRESAPGRWATSAPLNTRIQIRYTRPATVRPDETWQVVASFARRPSGGKPAEPLPIPPLEVTGLPTDPDVAIGRPIDAGALRTLGFGPGDVLEIELREKGESVFLELELIAAGEGLRP